MNPKQTIPLVTSLATAIPAILPALLLGGAFYLTLKWVFSEENKQFEAQATPPNAKAGILVKHAATTVHSAPIPAGIAPISVPAASKCPLSSFTPSAKEAAKAQQPKRVITRENMATAFHRGAETLIRNDAVSALIALGFHKSAAYEATLPDGRFADWLHFAPDGMIAWKG